MKAKLLRIITLVALALALPVLAAAAQAGQPPEGVEIAAQAVALAAGVLLILQGVKRITDQFWPELISGKVAVALALALSILGNIAAADPEAGLLIIILSTLGTLAGAAGGHDVLARLGTGRIGKR